MMNTSLDNKNTALTSVLQEHFKVKLNPAKVNICIFITAVCKIKTINSKLRNKKNSLN